MTRAEASRRTTFGDTRLPIRFWSKAESKPSGCWTWKSGLRTGYGRLYWNGSDCSAHRVAYQALVGPILDGLVLDHLCRNRACVNPSHLEPVTNKENIRRGDTRSAAVLATASRACEASAKARRAKTHCRRGHTYDESNTYRQRDGRHCRACQRIYQSAYKVRKRQGYAGSLAFDADEARKMDA